MKTILNRLMCLFAVMTVACSPDKDGFPEYGGPGDICEKPYRAVVEGESSNVLPEKTVSLKASAENASCYWWKKDGKLIEDASDATYTVTESGVYEAAGVNDFGRGEWSEPKTVTIEQEPVPFMEQLVGRWRVTEKVTYLSDLLANNHDVIIEKVDEETVRIFHFNDNTNSNDVVTAKVSREDCTFTIPYQEAVGCLYGDESVKCYYASAEEQLPVENVGKGIGPLAIKAVGDNLSVVFPSAFEISGGKGSEDIYPVTYYILAFDLNGNCLGMAALAADTVWTKL